MGDCSNPDDRLGTVALPGVEEGYYRKLWPKTLQAFQYAWKHHRDEADWFLKADDDTWMFMDNLRSLLGRYNASRPHYLGSKGSIWYQNESFHFGGAGEDL